MCGGRGSEPSQQKGQLRRGLEERERRHPGLEATMEGDDGACGEEVAAAPVQVLNPGLALSAHPPANAPRGGPRSPTGAARPPGPGPGEQATGVAAAAFSLPCSLRPPPPRSAIPRLARQVLLNT